MDLAGIAGYKLCHKLDFYGKLQQILLAVTSLNTCQSRSRWHLAPQTEACATPLIIAGPCSAIQGGVIRICCARSGAGTGDFHHAKHHGAFRRVHTSPPYPAPFIRRGLRQFEMLLRCGCIENAPDAHHGLRLIAVLRQRRRVLQRRADGRLSSVSRSPLHLRASVPFASWLHLSSKPSRPLHLITSPFLHSWRWSCAGAPRSPGLLQPFHRLQHDFCAQGNPLRLASDAARNSSFSLSAASTVKKFVLEMFALHRQPLKQGSGPEDNSAICN